jgi:peptidyl-prolyl cis-trans isomerase C
MNIRAYVWGVAAFAVTAIAIDTGPAHAQPDQAAEQVVARVGSSAITVGELNRRLGKIPKFQLATYGSSPDEVRRTFLQKVVIPEYLFAQAAQEQGIDLDFEVRGRLRDVLKGSVLREVREKGEAKTPVTDSEVAAYYNLHKAKYETPPRYAIWRILVASKQEAEQLIAEAKKDPTPKTWTELARTKSLDKSTGMRGGNLGFVSDSGDSSDGKLVVAKAIVDAVKTVKDGELVDQPVAEGAGWAVVWRRSSVPEVRRSLQQEDQNIRRTIAHERTVSTQEKLLSSLRERDLSNLNAAVLELVEVTSSGQVGARGKPGRIYRKANAGAPESTPRGLR